MSVATFDGEVCTTVHTRTVDATLADVRALVSDATRWPAVFGPCVHVDRLESTPRDERLCLWALVNGRVTSWTSKRYFDPSGCRVEFVQEVSRPPIASMRGAWSFRPLGRARTQAVLEHTFRATDGAEGLEELTAAVDRNSEEELAALARVAGLGYPLDEVLVTFSDAEPLRVDPTDAYATIAAADRWPVSLPHVRDVDLREEPGGVQRMEMETVTADGSVHHTESVRLCLPPDRIVYKQLRPPRLLLGHSGEWAVERDGGSGPVLRSTHTVTIDPSAVPTVLGPGATVADARAHLRAVLGANSAATLSVAAGGATARRAG